jgi:hypothetical protein
MQSVQTLPAPSPDYLATRFEPCGSFVDAGDADPICADCGWLHDEHGAHDARVPRHRPPDGTPR